MPTPTTSTSSPNIAGISQHLSNVKLSDISPYDLIDTDTALSSVVETLHRLPTCPPSIYIDLEGEKLSRHGTISIMQVHVLPSKRTYLIDIHVLREKAFQVCGSSGQTLKTILESCDIPKVFFDVRNDSDALYKHYNICLAGIQDLQLMELATRTFARKHVNGLAKCIERDGALSSTEMLRWKNCKERGVRLFAPERGGSYQVLNDRPLSEDMVQYCIQDVHFMPRLWDRYNGTMSSAWRMRVEAASKERVILSQSQSYVSHGRHKALGPSNWLLL
ncbi:hypothetical protein MY3296_006033 [Beauveria thailandica]